MQHYWSLDGVHFQDTWLTIGSFDGVHRGHQEVVQKLISEAQAAGSKSVVLTFYPHPATVLGKRKNAYYLTTPEQRALLLGELGVDVVVTLPFTKQLAEKTAGEFMNHLQASLGVSRLLVGHDFALGKGRSGNVEALRQIGARLGFTVDEIAAVDVSGERVSSSQIRTLILDGHVSQAAQLFGRPYSLQGEVVPGDGRGRTIGFPTANLNVWEQMTIPKAGVYICRALVGCETEKSYTAVTNIGVRPTFDLENPSQTIETHLLDQSENLYGQIVQLEFFERLRNEMRFPGIDALVAQIHHDADKARAYFMM